MRYFMLFLVSLTGYAETPAPQKLSETTLFENLAEKKVKAENRSYVPQYPLWTDGALKKRWVFLPANSTIQVDNPEQWIFPVGTKFWKEFSFAAGGKTVRVETRYMEKVGDGDWTFATYLWNKEETEATLVGEDGLPNHFEFAAGKFHSIPAATECMRCHRKEGDGVLGFDAIQLSNDRDPNALHKEAIQANDLLLKELIDSSRFNTVPAVFKNGNPKIPAKTEVGRTVFGYLHANCASCHNPRGSSMQVRMDVSVNLVAEEETALNGFKNLVDKRSLVFQFPGESAGKRVVKGSPETSVLFRMMESTGIERMPNLGTAVNDTAAIEKIREWIKNIQ